MFLVLGIFENMWANKETLFVGNMLGNIFASSEINIVYATNYSEVGKQGNIDRKLNISATIFPTRLRRALVVVFYCWENSIAPSCHCFHISHVFI